MDACGCMYEASVIVKRFLLLLNVEDRALYIIMIILFLYATKNKSIQRHCGSDVVDL